MRKIDALILRRADERQKTAQERVKRILQDARDREVEISVIGSSARRAFPGPLGLYLLVHGPADPRATSHGRAAGCHSSERHEYSLRSHLRVRPFCRPGAGTAR